MHKLDAWGNTVGIAETGFPRKLATGKLTSNARLAEVHKGSAGSPLVGHQPQTAAVSLPRARSFPLPKRPSRLIQRNSASDFVRQRGLFLFDGARLRPTRGQRGVGELALLGVGGGQRVEHPRVFSARELHRPHGELERVV